jgi:ubiquinone/menaquinone biosynthesis C-methylase UbiE
LPFKDGEASEVYASNVLEHFPHTRTGEVLKEWRRVLAPGGVLKVSVPDFDRAVEIYQKCNLAPWVINFLWGDQGYPGAFHYCGFNEVVLRSALKDAGFSDISRVDQLPGSDKVECSNNRSNMDGRLVSLNMVAIND